MQFHGCARALAVVVAAPLILIACGGPPTQAATGARSVATSTWHRYVQCVRDHGVANMPDPTVDDQGRASFPDDSPRVPDPVVQQCGPILDRLPTQPTAGADVAMRTRFAQCMRQQGIADFPDPDSQGRFDLPPSLAQGGNLKASARWPQFQAAMDGPCKQYNPTGHI